MDELQTTIDQMEYKVKTEERQKLRDFLSIYYISMSKEEPVEEQLIDLPPAE